MTTVLTGAAAAVVVCVLLTPAPPPMLLPDQGLLARIDHLEARIHELEAARRPDPPQPIQVDAPPRREVVVDPADPATASIAERLAQLEQQAKLLAAVVNGQNPTGAAAEPQPPTARALPKDEAEAARWILDPTLDVAQRVQAHGTLRHVPDAYSPAMVAALLNIATTNADGQLRADVWRFFDGDSTLPGIVAPLVRALQADDDARVREEAADTLGRYCDDPIVEPALQRAAQSDPSGRVRAKAQRTLQARHSFSTVGQAGWQSGR